MFWFMFLFLLPSFLEAGIISGAVVKTDRGDVLVQDLVVGDTVVASSNRSIQFNASITRITKTMVDSAICLDSGLGEFLVSDEQSIYDSETVKWVSACFLNEGSKLMDYRVEEREICELCNTMGPFDAYEIEFEQDCYFYVGPDHVMVEGMAYEKENK